MEARLQAADAFYRLTLAVLYFLFAATALLTNK